MTICTLLLICLTGILPVNITVYSPEPDEDHYVNTAVMTFFKGRYYCMWQSSERDEDSPTLMYASAQAVTESDGADREP